MPTVTADLTSIPYPMFFGDETSYESLAIWDILMPVLMVGFFIYNALGLSWLAPLISGSLTGTPPFQLITFLAYKSTYWWVFYFKLAKIVFQDYNATVMSAIMHSVTAPEFFIYYQMRKDSI